MTSTAVIMDTLPATHDHLSSSDNKLNEFYSTYEIHSPSPNSSPLLNKSSDSIVNKMNSDSSLSLTNRKESTLKLPYPVLSDHRDLSLILASLQNETQTTSKKISHVVKQIDECEQNLISSIYTENEKKIFKVKRVKIKQQLDALKKHERRVSLQIDFITTKTEIKCLDDEQKQMEDNLNSDESQQIKILSGKLKQKLDKMKVYMRTRNEQMKKIMNGKKHLNDNKKLSISSSQKQQQQHFNSSSTTIKDLNRKRPSTSTNNSLANKRLKSAAPIVRLSSRVTSHDLKNHSIQAPIVRFINKTTDSTINSTSPTTPASSSSTSSPALHISTDIGNAANIIKNSLQQNELPLVDDDDDDDDELNLELDIDELFNEDSYSEQTMQRFKSGINELTCQFQVKQDISKI
ncbi:unnamed protein product [Adineta steineri]|uniref:Uncharacterized protein n=1 Tax=Adineta steineri TaxID=433720 RepID=A0A815FEC4_9BILA|nr:unnamed protein product [Adineta steineri]CAF1585029.1 unnamed protein product [Adineta steineri]